MDGQDDEDGLPSSEAMNDLELVKQLAEKAMYPPSKPPMTFFDWLSQEGSGFLVAVIAIIIGMTVCSVVRLVTRSINIRKHGWPPPHCDADGDQPETNKQGE